MTKEMLLFLKIFKKKTKYPPTNKKILKTCTWPTEKKGKDILSDVCSHIATYLLQQHIHNYTFFFLPWTKRNSSTDVTTFCLLRICFGAYFIFYDNNIYIWKLWPQMHWESLRWGNFFKVKYTNVGKSVSIHNRKKCMHYTFR